MIFLVLFSGSDSPPVPKPRLIADLNDASDLLDESSNDPPLSNTSDQSVGPRKKKKAGLSRLKAKNHKDKEAAHDDETSSTVRLSFVHLSGLDLADLCDLYINWLSICRLAKLMLLKVSLRTRSSS